MNALLLAIPLLSLSFQAKTKVDLNVNAKPGEVISGERLFRVTVNAKNPVTEVEFYVNGDMRDSDTSTPYEFRLDTLAEQDGATKLLFKAYTTEGEIGEKTITVKIDNGLSQGLDFHVKKGLDLLTDSQFQSALTEGRIGLKIDPKSNAARIVLARAKLGLGVLDDAQRYVEDAVAQDPKDRQALDLLAFIDLKRAFTTVARADSNAGETQKAIADALQAGVEARRKSLNVGLDSVGQPTADNLVAYADAAIAARRYSLASQAIGPVFEKDPRRLDLANRLAFSQLREGRYKDALLSLTRAQRLTELDAYAYALLSIVYSDLGDPAKADDAMKNAMLKGPSDPVVRTAQAYLALTFTRSQQDNAVTLHYNYERAADTPERRQARQVFMQLAQDLVATTGNTPEVDYYLGSLYNRLEDYPKGQSYFERSALSEPINYDAYIEQGNKAISIANTSKLTGPDLDKLYESAKAMFQTALAARDDSSEALTGLAIVALFQGNPTDALKWSNAAVAANPSYAAARIAQSNANRKAAAASRKIADTSRASARDTSLVAGDRADLETKARAAEADATKFETQERASLNEAFKLDPQISGLEINDTKVVWRYYAVGGRRALIPAPK